MSNDALNKIVIGTANFGLHYGINNPAGKLEKNKLIDILNFAKDTGTDTLDTAALYGDSEDRIGEYLYKSNNFFNIVSKLPDCSSDETEKYLSKTLTSLKQDKIFGYILHNFDTYKKDRDIWKELLNLKTIGKINKTGFSLYYPEDIDDFLKNGDVPDLIQVPYNIFDRRFEKYFAKLKNLNIEIHVRSVFLQGMVFKSIDSLPGYFSKIKNKIFLINEISKRFNITVSELCFCFVLLNKYIDKIVVGIDSIEQLKELLNAGNKIEIVNSIMSELSVLKEDDEDILLPFKWKIE